MFYGPALLSSSEDAGAEAYVFALPVGRSKGSLAGEVPPGVSWDSSWLLGSSFLSLFRTCSYSKPSREGDGLCVRFLMDKGHILGCLLVVFSRT